MNSWPEIPDEIIECAFKVETWFRVNNIKAWRVGGVQSYPLESEMDTLKKFMIVLNNADKYPTEHELAEAALVARGKLNRLVEQRDAALKLARDFAGYSDDASLHGLTGAASAFWQCAKELRLALAPKEGK